MGPISGQTGLDRLAWQRYPHPLPLFGSQTWFVPLFPRACNLSKLALSLSFLTGPPDPKSCPIAVAPSLLFLFCLLRSRVDQARVFALRKSLFSRTQRQVLSCLSLRPLFYTPLRPVPQRHRPYLRPTPTAARSTPDRRTSSTSFSAPSTHTLVLSLLSTATSNPTFLAETQTTTPELQTSHHYPIPHPPTDRRSIAVLPLAGPQHRFRTPDLVPSLAFRSLDFPIDFAGSCFAEALWHFHSYV